MKAYTEQVKADAKAAANYIREHGWCQKNFELPGGQCCALGARNAVVFGKCDPWDLDPTPEQCREATEMRIAFMSEAGIDPYLSDITTWNDEPGRTKEEVLAVFDRIANG